MTEKDEIEGKSQNKGGLILTTDLLIELLDQAFLFGKNDGWENNYIEFRDLEIEKLKKGE